MQSFISLADDPLSFGQNLAKMERSSINLTNLFDICLQTVENIFQQDTGPDVNPASTDKDPLDDFNQHFPVDN